jgi:hypothetical protein
MGTGAQWNSALDYALLEAMLVGINYRVTVFERKRDSPMRPRCSLLYGNTVFDLQMESCEKYTRLPVHIRDVIPRSRLSPAFQEIGKET